MPDNPVEMTPEQAEQRETLIKMGYLASVIDTKFEPHEYAMLIQESLLEDVFPPDDDDEDDDDAYDPEIDPHDPRR